MTSIDLFDTSNCPRGSRCERCGDSTAEHVVATMETPVGVLCLTLCPVCARAGEGPRLKLPTAARLVGDHCMHLGIDVDQMAEQLRGDR